MRSIRIIIACIACFSAAASTAGAARPSVLREIRARYAILDSAILHHSGTLARSIFAPDYIETDIDGNKTGVDAVLGSIFTLRPDLQNVALSRQIDSITASAKHAEVHVRSTTTYESAGKGNAHHSDRFFQRATEVWEYRGNYWFLISSVATEQTQWEDGKIINHEALDN